jgi:hypothetical protein
VAVVYCIGWAYFAPHYDPNNPFAISGEPAPWVIAALALLVATAAAPFWTLTARSTMGSIVLNGMFPWFVVFTFVALWERVPTLRSVWPVVQAITAIVIVGYAALMIWLSRRLLTRYQVSAGGDLLLESPIPLPRFIQEALRCRPHAPIFNLVRKELRLMRPVWALTLFSATFWVLLSAFQLLPADEPHHPTPTTNSQLILLALAIVSNLLIAVLAGTVSLGEERTSGTHAWHMTLPVSARTQWMVKLLVSIAVSAICGAVIPLSILMLRGFASGSVFRFTSPDTLWIWPLALSTVTVVGFWSASTVSGAVRATLWLFPITWVLGGATALGLWGADSFGRSGSMESLAARFDPFSAGRSLANLFEWLDSHGHHLYPADPWVSLTPVLLLLFVQSYFLFRRQPSESKLYIARAILPGAVVMFVYAFALIFPLYAGSHLFKQGNEVLTETHLAIQQRQSQGWQASTEHPMQLTGDELGKQPAVSERTRRWLATASVTLAPLEHASPVERREFFAYVKAGPDKAHPAYTATVRQGDRTCGLRFQPYPLTPNVALTQSFPNRGTIVMACH